MESTGMSDNQRYFQASSSSMSHDMHLTDDENNFIEISVDPNEDDDNVEYIEYEDDDLSNYVVLEEEDDAEIENDESNQNMKFEEKSYTEHSEIVEDNIDDHSSTSNNEDMYHCSTCNIDFHSVEDHIAKFHKDQSVLFDVEEKDELAEREIESQEEAVPSKRTIKLESETEAQSHSKNIGDLQEIEGVEMYTIDTILDTDNMEVAEVEYINDTSDNTESVGGNDNEEMFFDSAGRPYIRKKVKIENVDLQSFKHDPKRNGKSSKIAKDDSAIDTIEGDESLPENFSILFICVKCDKKFSTERKLAYHTRVHHKSPDVLKMIKPKKSVVEQVVCEICNTIFPSNKSYRLHARMHGPIRVRPIEEAIGYEMKSSAKDGKLSNETFFCEICNKSYDISFQEVHKKSHKAGQKFVCTICNKKFANGLNLEMHLKAHQENPKPKPPTKAERAGTTLPYECAYCGRQFARPHEKVKHERIHTGEKPYKCEICGKCFRVAYCLTLHLRTHTAARPYVCPHCNKRFKAYSGYNHHLMTHSDERPYKCPHCPKAFKTSVQLAGHKNSHTKPFSCPHCNRPFASLYAVKAHMETHLRSSQTLKHRCPVCGAIYARVFALKDHMKEQHQTSFTEGDEVSDINIADVPFLNENETSAQSILPENVEEITIGEMDHFQAEEVVTDWLK
ncbi:unnamed protein product [Hermetia illucens]|uniref:C2H2-type domain-containing protein n=1 Tax=Hermetia illucens TaxID=343691 RepID=A0A7R8YV82_HERIL|nr:zinc finger protein 180-like [Hermetia illucens]CAD7086582.1 unnamed protein product [Hermetia illucens]